MREEERSLARRAALAWRWAWVAAVVVWPVFAHGCHAGDHDDELAVAEARQWEAQRD